jgi:HlyD family secretion protein
MTATADILTTEKQNVLLVPNAALRYSPEREAAAQRSQSGGVTSVLVPRNPRRGGGGGGGQQRQVSIGRGSQQTVYVLDDDGAPQPVRITVGESNGSETEVLSGALRPGMAVVTGRLAPGQTQERSSGGRAGSDQAGSDQPATSGSGRNRRAAAANGG